VSQFDYIIADAIEALGDAHLETEEAVGRLKVINAALEFNGTPYQHMGTSKGGGVDCATLLTEAFAAGGAIEPTKLDFYPRNFHLHQSEELYLGRIERWATKVPRETYLPADIVLFRFGRCISHSAIVLAYPVVIHAWAKGGHVQLDEMDNAPLSAHRVAGIWSVWPKRKHSFAHRILDRLRGAQ
jgi:cell wall-associated NlpC family hydrolase